MAFKDLNNKHSFWPLFGFLKEYKSLLCLLVITSMTAALLEGVTVALVFPVLQIQQTTTALPLGLSHVLGPIMALSIVDRLKVVAVLLLVVTIIKNAFLYTSSLLSSRLQIVVIKHFRIRCLESLMLAGINYINTRQASDFQIIIDGYTDSVTGAIVGLATTALPQIFTTLLLSSILLVMSWPLTLAAVGVVLVASLLLHQISRNILKASRIVYEARMAFNRSLLDIINGMKLIRLFNRQDAVRHHFYESVDAFNRAKFSSDQLVLMVSPAFETIGIGMLAVILLMGAWLMPTSGQGWVGGLLAFIVVLSRLISPIKIINNARAMIIEKMPMIEHITSLLSTSDKEYMTEGHALIPQFQKGISFENVDFAYASNPLPVLRNVSFTIVKGTTTAIVGPSGSGKSTIIELLLRFYDPENGHICIDDIDLKDIILNSWRKHIGVVSQDIILFNDTVRHNISFARPEASQAEIEDAAERAYAHEFILSLPNGYDTVIGERGVLLSGGQRQRLAIARAVLIQPQLLIFDEATSALDVESEKVVQQAVAQLGCSRTVICIAHRLATVRDADQILVLHAGRLVEQGNHSQLMALNGLYSGMVRLQELETQVYHR